MQLTDTTRSIGQHVPFWIESNTESRDRLKIRKEGRQTINRDEGRFLLAKVSDRDRNVQVNKYCRLCFEIIVVKHDNLTSFDTTHKHSPIPGYQKRVRTPLCQSHVTISAGQRHDGQQYKNIQLSPSRNARNPSPTKFGLVIEEVAVLHL